MKIKELLRDLADFDVNEELYFNIEIGSMILPEGVANTGLPATIEVTNAGDAPVINVRYKQEGGT